MPKSLKIFLTLAVLLAIILILQNLGNDKSSNTLKIGAILPLTGDFGSLGEEIKRGAEIATEEAHAKGKNFDFVIEDDKSQSTGSVNATNKLINIDKIDAVFTATVQEVKPIAPIFNQAQTPLLTVWDSNDYLKTAGPYIFTTGFSTEKAGEKMAVYAIETLKLKTVAIIPQIDEWSELIAKSFEEKFKALGGTITMRESAQVTQKDFRTLIAKAKTSNADGIYLPLLPTSAGPFLLQAKELGFKGKLMTADSFSQDDINIAKNSAEGVYVTTLHADNAQILTEKYKAKYGTEPFDIVFVSFGYDAINTLLEANKISLKNNITLTEALKQVSIDGAGGKIELNNSQFFEREEKMYKVQNGKIELITE